ncbi:hypothetical protein CYJ10_30960 [Cupriavidus pauculus]|uniref:Uncharacterized protein n=1 Tax=Cupriavidus pauculus TaxID=82633 RepID=A0A2N5C349_9BURK|nr:hypothetical protein CYJ10_30960 [Cupriavidus pauculus]
MAGALYICAHHHLFKSRVWGLFAKTSQRREIVFIDDQIAEGGLPYARRTTGEHRGAASAFGESRSSSGTWGDHFAAILTPVLPQAFVEPNDLGLVTVNATSYLAFLWLIEGVSFKQATYRQSMS